MRTLALLLLLAGCATPRNCAISEVSTVFGLQVVTYSTSQAPSIKVGLIRNEYTALPTATNALYTAPFATRTVAVQDGWNNASVERDLSSAAVSSTTTGATGSVRWRMGAQ